MDGTLKPPNDPTDKAAMFLRKIGAVGLIMSCLAEAGGSQALG